MALFRSKHLSNSGAVVNALWRSLAVIEFDPAGHIVTANANFCTALGYSLAEIKGRHHSLFVDPEYASSADYREFWAKLARGEFDSREYLRIGKGGRRVWIRATYNPIKNTSGRVIKIVKLATDITAEKLLSVESERKITAISRVQAMIEFTNSGEVITANEIFLQVMGYTLAEVQGKHHSLFLDPGYAESSEYRDFWRTLLHGHFVSAEFKRVRKDGSDIWIQASYNPILDQDGNVLKIVKFATDVTERVRAVSGVANGLAQLAGKNLKYRILHAFDPAFEKLRVDFNTAMSQLSQTMHSIAASTQDLCCGAENIHGTANDLSRHLGQQAASLEEAAVSLDDITATVRRSAEGATQATGVASRAKADVVQSGKVMDDAVSAMSEIQQSSAKITHIISVIDEIAFQTNLLALNAGVEAARAGDSGRGFAVVAQEVRALAQRSAEAAKEIKTLIASSSEQVRRGVELVGEGGRALGNIAVKVGDIDALIADIARSSQEQAAGLGQVNTSVKHMDQTTQQNATKVEEASAAASHAKAKSLELAHLVGRFTIGESADAAVRFPPDTSRARQGVTARSA